MAGQVAIRRIAVLGGSDAESGARGRAEDEYSAQDLIYKQVQQPASLPAPGGRGRDSGTLCVVGYCGYSWSSSVPAGNSAYYLDFGHGGINPQTSSSRSYGFQVRCLQE